MGIIYVSFPLNLCRDYEFAGTNVQCTMNSFVLLANKLSFSLKIKVNYDLVLHIANSDFPYFSSLLDKEIRAQIKTKIVVSKNYK